MTKKYNTQEAARRLGVTPQTIRNWIESGVLKAKRKSPLPGSPYQITEHELKIFEQKRRIV